MFQNFLENFVVKLGEIITVGFKRMKEVDCHYFFHFHLQMLFRFDSITKKISFSNGNRNAISFFGLHNKISCQKVLH